MVFIQKIRKIVRWLTPYGLIMLQKKKIQEKDVLFLPKKLEIKDYFLNLNYDEQEPKIVEIIDYLRKYKFSSFPYEFARSYHKTDIDVFYDKSNNTPYVIHKNKRLYFPDKWSVDRIQVYQA